MTGDRESALTAGFDVARMLMLIAEAKALLEPHAAQGTDWGERARTWLMDRDDWHDDEDARQGTDEPRERIDRPEREQEPTVRSAFSERDAGWKRGRDQAISLRHDGRYTAEARTALLGQAHIDVHQAWARLGEAEGHRDVLHRLYGYPRSTPEGSS